MDLIPLPPPVEIPVAQSAAINELAHVNAALARRVEEHIIRFKAFWQNYAVTPDDILVAMGQGAPIWLAAAGESVHHIGNLAAIVGKTSADFLPLEYTIPPRNFIVGPPPSYTVTLEAPQQGFDAWGRPLPPEPTPEPEQPTEPQPE